MTGEQYLLLVVAVPVAVYVISKVIFLAYFRSKFQYHQNVMANMSGENNGQAS